MNPFSLLSIAAAGISLVLSVWLFISGLGNQSLQNKWQAQQQELQNQQQEVASQQQAIQLQQSQIQTGRYLAEQVGPAVLREIGTSVVQKKNEKLRGLLARYGMSVQESTPAPGGAGGSGTTAAPPRAASTPAATSTPAAPRP